jgi:hypothetical protein
MSRLFIRLILCVTVFFVASCAQSKKVGQNTPHIQFKQCPDDRPQMCTREYLPVCATRDTGVRCVTAPCPSSEQKTYGNACTACADEKVFGYTAEACASEPELKHR